jgi:hypothetical protein
MEMTGRDKILFSDAISRPEIHYVGGHPKIATPNCQSKSIFSFWALPEQGSIEKRE